MIQAIAPSPDETFLEIGPGHGALTRALAPRVRQIVAVEIDRDLAHALPGRVPDNVRVITGDFLSIDLNDALRAERHPLRVAGNLPYNISSPILFKLLSASRLSADLIDATVMLQREVAERLIARPGTKDYGVLTIFTALQADVTRLLTLPPGAFRPPPKVDSVVVRLSFRPSVLPAGSEDLFGRMVRTMSSKVVA